MLPAEQMASFIRHSNRVAFLKTIFLLLVAAILSALGLLVPAHLRSVDPVALEAAASAGRSTKSEISESLNAAHTGPASQLLKASKLEASGDQRQTIAQLHQNKPILALSGGPDKSFEAFLQLFPESRIQAGQVSPVVPLLLPSNDREAMAHLLRESNNANVQALLNIRNLRGMIQLHPADHAAGAPYDAGLLTMTQLIESGHIDTSLADQIGDLATQAALENTRAIAAIEELVMATLSLGRQLDFHSLANLAVFTDSLGAWAQMATLFRAEPGQSSQLYATLHYEEQSQPLFDYLSQYPETGIDDLSRALLLGPGSVSYLLSHNLPLQQDHPTMDRILEILSPFRPAVWTELSVRDRTAALALKLALFLSGGLAFALAMGAAWRGSSKTTKEVSRFTPSVLARDFFIACVFALTLWILFEPDILKSSETTTDSGPRIEFAVASALESIQSPVKAMQELNQVTLLVLVLFFIIQLVIYCFCLIKLKEIGKQSHSASIKLQLLENEENLFDFGLYVGLGGTVLALIMVAVGIVEASLMAAYASTLFGILFVALLKVLHLRPYRRKLILEAGAQTRDQSGNLMKNIEL